MDKKLLNERDICTKFITPAIKRAGWDVMSQIREEVGFTKGRIIVRGKLVSRGKAKRALKTAAKARVWRKRGSNDRRLRLPRELGPRRPDVVEERYVGQDPTDGRFADVTLRKCARCQRLWLR